MSQQRAPGNTYEDGKDTGIPTTHLAWVEDASDSTVTLTEGRRGTHQIVYDQSDGTWVLEEIT